MTHPSLEDLKMTHPSLERLDLLVNVRTNWPSGSSQGATQAEHTWMQSKLLCLSFIDRIPNLLVAFPEIS
jgi:hypothetical protein